MALVTSSSRRVCREQAVTTAQVVVLVYAADDKKWSPSGAGAAVCELGPA